MLDSWYAPIVPPSFIIATIHPDAISPGMIFGSASHPRILASSRPRILASSRPRAAARSLPSTNRATHATTNEQTSGTNAAIPAPCQVCGGTILPAARPPAPLKAAETTKVVTTCRPPRVLASSRPRILASPPATSPMAARAPEGRATSLVASASSHPRAASRLTPHASRLTPHTSRLTPIHRLEAPPAPHAQTRRPYPHAPGCPRAAAPAPPGARRAGAHCQ